MESKAPHEEGRRFRARPLNIHEPLPIVECTPELRKQQPELYQWLQSEGSKRGERVQVVNEEGDVIRVEPWRPCPKKRIDIPSWTATEEPLSVPVPSDEPPFRRHLAPILGEAKYVADDEDDDWIRKCDIDVVQFESIVTKLEHLHYQRLEGMLTARAENGRMFLVIPTVQEVLTKKEAAKEIDINHLAAVYNYWVTKRQRTQKPLLDVYWNAFPWSAILDRSRRRGMEKKEETDGLKTPFVGALKQMPPTSTKIPLTEQLRRLKCIRQDLEAARTLADRVRRREKLKKRRDTLLLDEIEDESSRGDSVDRSDVRRTEKKDTNSTSTKPEKEEKRQGENGVRSINSGEVVVKKASEKKPRRQSNLYRRRLRSHARWQLRSRTTT